MTEPTRTYYYRGRLEKPTWRRNSRGKQVSYRWVDAYSQDIDGCISYPWMTKSECRQDARSQGLRAVFVSLREGDA